VPFCKELPGGRRDRLKKKGGKRDEVRQEPRKPRNFPITVSAENNPESRRGWKGGDNLRVTIFINCEEKERVFLRKFGVVGREMRSKESKSY